MDIAIALLTNNLLCFFILLPIISAEVDNTLYGVQGDAISMECDLQNADGSFISFGNRSYYLNSGEPLTANLPSDKMNRISVECSNPREVCHLRISDLKASDEGQYECGYQQGGTRITSSSASLIVARPPANSSPECLLYNNIDALISPDTAKVGDRVKFNCIVTGGYPVPSVRIELNGLVISQTQSNYITMYRTLIESDEGTTFTCVMSHRALTKPRYCTFLTFSRHVSTTTTTATTSQQMTSRQPTSSLRLSTIITLVVFGTLFLIIMSVICVLCSVKRKRIDKDKTKTCAQPSSSDLKMDSVSPQPVSTDYATVNIHEDSKEEHKPANINQTGENKLAADNFPVYAKPDKSSKRKTQELDAVIQQLSSLANVDTSCNGENGITYADVELSADVSNRSAQRERHDATVYADIEHS